MGREDDLNAYTEIRKLLVETREFLRLKHDQEKLLFTAIKSTPYLFNQFMDMFDDFLYSFKDSISNERARLDKELIGR